MKITHLTAILALAAFASSCANRGIGPQGGPVDSIPPHIVKSIPENGTLNYQKKEIQLRFDEYIQLSNPSENILISPPQQKPAEITAVGKRIKVALQEDLKENMTYTIDFGEAIQDNNEKNPLKNYSFSFSTGEQIDSLAIYGTLIDAENLNPLSGIVVGFHSDLADSSVSTRPFDRIGRTNTDGEFSILNIHQGTYRLYALDDVSRDYVRQPGEGFAFCDSLIVPTIVVRSETDTVWKDSLQGDSTIHYADSIYTAEYYFYEPSDILLRFFHEDKQHQYFQRIQRAERHRFTLSFSAPLRQMPELRALRPESDSLGKDTTWRDFTQHILYQYSPQKDTLICWLTDSTVLNMDSLRFALTYLKTDSAYALIPQTDTLLAVFRQPQVPKQKKKKQSTPEKEIHQAGKLGCNAKQDFHLADTLTITAPSPLSTYSPSGIHLAIKADTLWQTLPFHLHATDSTYRKIQILFDMQPATEYRLTIDSAALYDIWKTPFDRQSWTVKTRSLDTYATLKVHLEPYEPKAMLQLLDGKDVPVLTTSVANEGVLLTNLQPGAYYMRIFIDSNDDGRWTTGDWSLHRQPEEVFYFPKKLNLRANWDFEETFRWQELPLLEQKPRALIPQPKKK